MPDVFVKARYGTGAGMVFPVGVAKGIIFQSAADERFPLKSSLSASSLRRGSINFPALDVRAIGSRILFGRIICLCIKKGGKPSDTLVVS